ncbi:nucleotide exchange factor GrpE [Rhodococcus aetherivorans]|uniref:nucleotide exchange factor GrpE n=1 Tax=Rhodococcus aetherivorans TaxID=191292 RepID=UPI0036724671
MFQPESGSVDALNDPVTLVIHLTLVAIVGAGCLLLGSMLARHRHIGLDPPTPMGSTDPTTTTDTGAEDIVDTLIRVHDLSHNDAVSSYVESCLARRGITVIDDPVGCPYDAGTQQVVATEPAPSPDRVGRVCRQVRPGWRHQRTVLRPAEVTVWTTGPQP